MLNFIDFINNKDKLLLEMWVGDLYKDKDIIPIYKNPTKQDIINLKKSGLIENHLRFCAVLETKELFIWSGWGATHTEVIEYLIKTRILKKEIQSDDLDYVFCGECDIISGKLSLSQNKGNDTYFDLTINKLIKNDYNGKYYLPLPYYNDLNKFLEDLLHLIKKYSWISKYIEDYHIDSSLVRILNLSKR